MWNKTLQRLRWRTTYIYASIFGTLIVLVVALTYLLLFNAFYEHEKEELVAKAYHEAEEYIATGELPVSEVAIKNGSQLAYIVEPKDGRVILNQLGSEQHGLAVLEARQEWPDQDEETVLLSLISEEQEYKYLAAVVDIKPLGAPSMGKLYLFKNMAFYYQTARESVLILVYVAVAFFLLAIIAGYILAGRSIRPLSEMYERQQQFSVDASHEMRTPLAVMKLAVTGLEQEQKEKTPRRDLQEEYLAILSQEVKRLQHLIESLMQLARNERDDGSSQQERIDLGQLFKEVIQGIRLVAATKDINIAAKIEASCYVNGKREALEQLLVILLDNAVKYSPQGSQIQVRLEQHENYLSFKVQDQGPGIAKKDREKIFQRFYRVDKARSRNQGGLGLGLAIAQQIVELHGGSIAVQPLYPGSCFHVLLPAA